MVLTDQQKKEFEAAVRPLMKFLSDYHTHCSVIVRDNCVEMVEGIKIFKTDEYVKD